MRKKLLVLVISAAVITGCESNSFKTEDIGTATGAIIGGLLGSQVGSDTTRIIAIAVGAAAGAYLGRKIASWLDEQDQQDVAVVGGNALEGAGDGETVSWKNPDTGLTVTATPTDTKQVSREIAVLRLKSVEKYELQIIGDPYVAKQSSNLRAGPSVNAAVVGGLRPGEGFEAIGRVVDFQYKGAGWIAVGKGGGRLVGYVWEPLVKISRTDQTNQTLLTTGEDIRKEHNAKASEPVDLDALDIRVSEDSSGADLDSLFEEDTITADTKCRDMDVAVEKGTEDGGSSVTACKAPNGAWEII